MSQVEKELYRRYIERVSPFVNYSAICNELKIDYANFKKFKSGTNRCLSIEKLEKIKLFIAHDFVNEKEREN